MSSKPSKQDLQSHIPFFETFKSIDDDFRKAVTTDSIAIAENVYTVLREKPYLLFSYLLIGFLAFQGEIFPQLAAQFWQPTIGAILIIAFSANALLYTETVNVLSDKHQIEKPINHAFKNFYRVVFSTLLTSLITIVGLVLLVIPGIYLSVKLTFAPVVAVIDDGSIIDSLRLSYNNTKGSFVTIYTIFGLIGMVLFPVVIITLLLGSQIGLFALVLTMIVLIFPLVQIILASTYLHIEAE